MSTGNGFRVMWGGGLDEIPIESEIVGETGGNVYTNRGKRE